jgi:hypothetical protein
MWSEFLKKAAACLVAGLVSVATFALCPKGDPVTAVFLSLYLLFTLLFSLGSIAVETKVNSPPSQ